jgi:hypothetical protein
LRILNKLVFQVIEEIISRETKGRDETKSMKKADDFVDTVMKRKLVA